MLQPPDLHRSRNRRSWVLGGLCELLQKLTHICIHSTKSQSSWHELMRCSSLQNTPQKCLKRPPSQSPAQGVTRFRASCCSHLLYLTGSDIFHIVSLTLAAFLLRLHSHGVRLVTGLVRSLFVSHKISDGLKLCRGSALASRTPASSALSCFTSERAAL